MKFLHRIEQGVLIGIVVWLLGTFASAGMTDRRYWELPPVWFVIGAGLFFILVGTWLFQLPVQNRFIVGVFCLGLGIIATFIAQGEVKLVGFSLVLLAIVLIPRRIKSP